MPISRSVAALVAAPLFFVAGYALHRQPAPAAPAPTAADSTADVQNAIVHYAAGAPQLQFIRAEGVLLLPEPLLEPLNGRVAYDENHTARVTSPIAGRVVKIEVQPGDAVKAGAPLAWIDAPDYAAAVADARKSDADVRQKERSYARAKELLDGGVIPRKDAEAAETDLRQSQAEAQRAKLKLRNLTAGGASLAGDGKLALRAPISGIVADRKVNPGAEVRPDSPDPLFLLTDPKHLWVIVDLPERYLGRIRVGQTVSIEVDAYKGVDVSGHIASIGTVLDPATRRVQVRCVVDNTAGILKPEMFARVVPLSEERQKLERVPNSAIVSEGLYSFVFVETQPGVFEKRRITLGLQGRDESYVKSGLAPGDRVVTSGAMLLQSELAAQH